MVLVTGFWLGKVVPILGIVLTYFLLHVTVVSMTPEKGATSMLVKALADLSGHIEKDGVWGMGNCKSWSPVMEYW